MLFSHKKLFSQEKHSWSWENFENDSIWKWVGLESAGVEHGINPVTQTETMCDLDMNIKSDAFHRRTLFIL